MLADKTLLSATLFVTFVAGASVGYMARNSMQGGMPPRTPEAIYARQLDELHRKGYDDAEMAEARKAYSEYLESYERWWNDFLDVHRKNLDLVDEKLDKRLAELDARHVARTAPK